MVSTHGKPCSCSLGCGNRRRWEGPTLAERAADEALDDQFDALYADGRPFSSHSPDEIAKSVKATTAFAIIDK
jgi:hypothetical protein